MTDQPGAVVVRISGVDKLFGAEGGTITTALQDINLDIRRGEFLSLIGPSGCGKSTCCASSGTSSSQRPAR